MKVADIMRRSAVTVHETDTLAEAARIMLQHERRGLPVVNGAGEICGFLSVSDYLAREKAFPFSRFKAFQLFGKWVPNEGIEEIYDASHHLSVKDLMSTPAYTVTEEDTIDRLVEMMSRYGLSRIPVVRDRIPVGIVTRLDLLKIMLRTPAAAPTD